MHIVLLHPRSPGNLATCLRSAQNLGVGVVMVVGGVVADKWKGDIHRFRHQMNTQDALSEVTLLYYPTVDDWLRHLPAQTELVVVETLAGARSLVTFEHPRNATYVFGSEIQGVTPTQLAAIEAWVARSQRGVPMEHLARARQALKLHTVALPTPQSLNLGVCASVVLYDRWAKARRKEAAGQ